MIKLNKEVNSLQNTESPFTELFSILTRSEQSEHFPELVYDSKELRIINCHISNAMDILLQGLQSLGLLMSMVDLDEKKMHENLDIGFLISGIGNLTEALNSLRLDADYVLRKRGVMDY